MVTPEEAATFRKIGLELVPGAPVSEATLITALAICSQKLAERIIALEQHAIALGEHALHLERRITELEGRGR